MSTHTPEPWRAAGVDEALEGWKICDTGPTQNHDDDGASEYIATVYDAANVPLIVAAPVMLIALKGILAALSQAKTYPADIRAARLFAAGAIDLAEGIPS